MRKEWARLSWRSPRYHPTAVWSPLSLCRYQPKSLTGWYRACSHGRLEDVSRHAIRGRIYSRENKVCVQGCRTVLDLGWSGWSTIISIIVALVPAVVRFRQVLQKSLDLITELVGIVVLLGGLFVYVTAMPQWVQIQDQLARLSATSSPTLGEEVQSLHILFFGSIGLMMLGGLLTLFGLMGRVMMGSKNVMMGSKKK